MTYSRRRTFTALLGSAAVVLGGGVVAPVFAAPPAQPTVQAVELQSSQTAVTSSTSQSLRVQVSASQAPNQASGNSVSVKVSTGTSDRSEIHEWTFPVDGSTLTIAGNGTGTLSVPDSNLAPFGSINLKIKPIGDPTTQMCAGAPRSQTQKVSLDGTFFFDTLSKGSHKWGSVGQQAGKFTFSSTNTVTTSYLVTDPSCFNYTPPCATSVFWQAGPENLVLFGVAAGKRGSLFGSRTKSLSTPAGASRLDEAYGTTKKLVLETTGTAASLSVTHDTNSKGSATLTAKKHGKGYSTDCEMNGRSKVETSTTWGFAKYKNGPTPLTVKAQIFGAMKVADTTEAQITRTELT